MKRFLHVIYIFILSLGFSAIWELSQMGFYAINEDYKADIPQFLSAAIRDSLIIVGLYLFLSLIHRNTTWERWWTVTDTLIIALTTLGVAVFSELRALNLGSLVYSQYMPLIPGLGTGIVPTIQLCLTAFIVFYIARTKLTG